MFDPPDSVPWSKLSLSDVDTPAHRALALQVARESMVLLKNQGNVLPLGKNLRTVAVIGPNADRAPVLLGNYNGTPADPITPLRGIRAGTARVHPGALRPRSGSGGRIPRLPEGAGYPVHHARWPTRPSYGLLREPDARWRSAVFGHRQHGGRRMGTRRAAQRPEPRRLRGPLDRNTPRPAQPAPTGCSSDGTMKFDLWVDDTLVVSSAQLDADAPRGEFPRPVAVQSGPLALDSGTRLPRADRRVGLDRRRTAPARLGAPQRFPRSAGAGRGAERRRRGAGARPHLAHGGRGDAAPHRRVQRGRPHHSRPPAHAGGPAGTGHRARQADGARAAQRQRAERALGQRPRAGDPRGVVPRTGGRHGDRRDPVRRLRSRRAAARHLLPQREGSAALRQLRYGRAARIGSSVGRRSTRSDTA